MYVHVCEALYAVYVCCERSFVCVVIPDVNAMILRKTLSSLMLSLPLSMLLFFSLNFNFGIVIVVFLADRNRLLIIIIIRFIPSSPQHCSWYQYLCYSYYSLILNCLSSLAIASINTHPHHHHVCPCCVVSVVLLIIMLSSSQDNYTALMAASQNGHGDVVNALITHGADVNAKTVVWTIQ